MDGAYNTIDLAQLALSPGEGRRLDLEADVPELSLGGQAYSLHDRPQPVRLEISRTAAGHAFHLAFRARVEGPCVRCLGHADVAVDVEAREVDQQSTSDEELRSP